MALDETLCGPLCQHPSCWASNHRLMRGAPRSLAQTYMQAEAADNDDGLPTQAVVNLLAAYGPDPDSHRHDNHRYDNHRHDSRVHSTAGSAGYRRSQQVSRSEGSLRRSRDSFPQLKTPLASPTSLLHASSGQIPTNHSSPSDPSEPALAPPRLNRVEVQQVFDVGNFRRDKSSQSGAAPPKCYVWVPNPKSQRRKNAASKSLPEGPLVDSSGSIMPRDMTELMVPSDVEYKREKTKSHLSHGDLYEPKIPKAWDAFPVTKKRLKSPKLTGQPLSRVYSSRSPGEAYYGIYELLDLPKDVLLKVLEHINPRDLLDRDRLALALSRAFPRLEGATSALAMAYGDVLTQRRLMLTEVAGDLPRRDRPREHQPPQQPQREVTGSAPLQQREIQLPPDLAPPHNPGPQVSMVTMTPPPGQPATPASLRAPPMATDARQPEPQSPRQRPVTKDTEPRSPRQLAPLEMEPGSPRKAPVAMDTDVLSPRKDPDEMFILVTKSPLPAIPALSRDEDSASSRPKPASISLGLPTLPSGVRVTKPFMYKHNAMDLALGPVPSPPPAPPVIPTPPSSPAPSSDNTSIVVTMPTMSPEQQPPRQPQKELSNTKAESLLSETLTGPENTWDQAQTPLHNVSPSFSTNVPKTPAATPATRGHTTATPGHTTATPGAGRAADDHSGLSLTATQPAGLTPDVTGTGLLDTIPEDAPAPLEDPPSVPKSRRSVRFEVPSQPPASPSQSEHEGAEPDILTVHQDEALSRESSSVRHRQLLRETVAESPGPPPPSPEPSRRLSDTESRRSQRSEAGDDADSVITISAKPPSTLDDQSRIHTPATPLRAEGRLRRPTDTLPNALPALFSDHADDGMTGTREDTQESDEANEESTEIQDPTEHQQDAQDKADKPARATTDQELADASLQQQHSSTDEQQTQNAPSNTADDTVTDQVADTVGDADTAVDLLVDTAGLDQFDTTDAALRDELRGELSRLGLDEDGHQDTGIGDHTEQGTGGERQNTVDESQVEENTVVEESQVDENQDTVEESQNQESQNTVEESQNTVEESQNTVEGSQNTVDKSQNAVGESQNTVEENQVDESQNTVDESQNTVDESQNTVEGDNVAQEN